MNKGGKKRKILLPINIKTDGKAALFTLGFCFLYLIGEIIYKLKVERQGATFEFVLLFLLFAVFGIFRKLFYKDLIPVNHKGEPLPVGKEKADKKERNRFYCKSAFIYALIVAVMVIIAFNCSAELNNVNVGEEILSGTTIPNFLFSLILALIFAPFVFAFTYMIEYMWYEYKIALYNTLKNEDEDKKEEHITATEIKVQEPNEENIPMETSLEEEKPYVLPDVDEIIAQMVQKAEKETEEVIPVKKPRGRPRKNPLPAESKK